MSIIVLISVIFTILSATSTEVTIKGLGSLALAIFALVLGVRSWDRLHHTERSSPSEYQSTILESTFTGKPWRQTSIRLAVGGVIAGVVLAIVVAALLSTVLGRVLDRLN